MEPNLVINPGVAIWVTESSLYENLSWKVSGTAIDGYHGFGSEMTRYFDGEVILLSSKIRLIQNIAIAEVHFSREGFKWVIENIKSLPDIPFLISADLEVQMIFNGWAEVIEDSGEIDFSDTNDFYIYPVGTKDWFGILEVQGNKRVHLVAFSSKKDVEIIEEDEIWSFEWDCFLCKIKLLKFS